MQGLRDHADDPAFQKKWQEVKLLAKQKAARKIEALTGVQCTELWAPTAFSEYGASFALLHGVGLYPSRAEGWDTAAVCFTALPLIGVCACLCSAEVHSSVLLSPHASLRPLPLQA